MEETRDLTQAGAYLQESFFRLEAFSLAPLPPGRLLLVEEFGLLVVDELVQQFLVVCKGWRHHSKPLELEGSTLLEKVEEVAPPLLGDVLPSLRVHSVHRHQHLLVLTPAKHINNTSTRTVQHMHYTFTTPEQLVYSVHPCTVYIP